MTGGVRRKPHAHHGAPHTRCTRTITSVRLMFCLMNTAGSLHPQDTHTTTKVSAESAHFTQRETLGLARTHQAWQWGLLPPEPPQARQQGYQPW